MNNKEILELDKLFINHASTNEVVNFIETHIEDVCYECHESLYMESIYDEKYVVHYSISTIKMLCKVYTSFAQYRYFIILGIVINNSNIPEIIRGCFWWSMYRCNIDYYSSIKLFWKEVYADNRYIRKNYFSSLEEEDKVWRPLYCESRHEHEFMKFTPQLKSAIKSDSISQFEITLLLSNKKITMLLLLSLIAQNSVNIFCHLLESSKVPFKVATPQDWIFYLCKEANEEFAIRAIDKIEELHPNSVATAFDHLGNTPLWWTLYRDEDSSKLVANLIAKGCDVNCKNRINLSYAIVMEAKKILTDS